MDKVKEILSYGKGNLTVGRVCAAIAVIIVCIILAKLLAKLLKRIFAKTSMDNSTAGFFTMIARVIVYFVAFIIACDFIGIPITSLLAVFSVIGLALSLSVQDVLSNLISGFVITFTDPFDDGDYIEIADKSGTVTSISFMYTTLTTSDNKIVLIPNHEVSVSNIVNYTRADKRRIELLISASYDNTAAQVRSSITRAFEQVEGILDDPAPAVGVKEYGSSAVVYSVRVWCKTGSYWDTYYALNELIKTCFDEDGIEMTYDHVNVHVIEDKSEKK